MMSDANEHWMLGSGSYCINPEADTDDLLNDAAEWLECARALTDILKETIRDATTEDRRRMIHALGAIGMLTHMGCHCAVHAHARMSANDRWHEDPAAAVIEKITQ